MNLNIKDMKQRHLFTLLALGLSMQLSAQTIDLSGEWQFAQGDKPEYNDRIQLPGSMTTRGKGDKVDVNTRWTGSTYDSSFYFNPYMKKYQVEGNIKFPFFLTPEHHYVGNAWYRKTVAVPQVWNKQRVMLYLERPHIETTVWVNGQLAGRDSSLSVPHEWDITPYIKYGAENAIEVRVYNGIENVCVGQDSHSVTDQTQGNWNGIVGRMELQARPQQYLRNVQVYPDVENRHIRVTMDVVGSKKKGNFVFLVDGQRHQCKGVKEGEDGLFAVTLPMGADVKLWDEFTPNLYTLTTILGTDTMTTHFGMRRITAEGRQFYMNGRKTWMRGTVENCCFPETGYAPTDVESWLGIFRKCKQYGLNFMRFHSFCPPEAAFEAADQVGFYLQPEGPSWPNHGVRLGNGMSIDRYLMEETQRMVARYGNHPSFCFLACGNEPAGNWVEWVGDFVDAWKATGDDRRLYTGASVGGGWAWDPKSQYHVKGGARGLNWDRKAPQSEDNFNDNMLKVTQKGKTVKEFDNNEPFLSHETGQWCAFPDLKETSQYTGAYKARNFEIFADLLRDNGMASQAEKFLHASGKLQTLAYKYDIERNLRTRDFAGFQMLSLNDYSGQGTALVGVLNVHWREKGYCDSTDWHQFCAPVVPLAKFPKFVYTDMEVLSVPVELYNASQQTLKDAHVTYRIHDEQGREYANGTLCCQNLPVDKNIDLRRVACPLSMVQAPAKLTLHVQVEGTQAHNQWDFWVYPTQVEMPKADDVLITDTLDAKALQTLEQGGKVLVLAGGKVKMGADVKQTYLPVFWNTSWFKMRPPHTTGATIDKQHPLFKHFLTDDWSNLNWWELLNKAQVINLREFPFGYQPAIQPIDTWHVSRKLGMMVEANVGKGKLLLTTMDLTTDLNRRVVARQMRKAILEYMTSADFAPSITVEPQTITRLFTHSAPAVNMFTNESPDELKPKIE